MRRNNRLHQSVGLVVFEIAAFALIESNGKRLERLGHLRKLMIEPELPLDGFCNSLRVKTEDLRYPAQAAREFMKLFLFEIVATGLEKERVLEFRNKVRRGHAHNAALIQIVAGGFSGTPGEPNMLNLRQIRSWPRRQDVWQICRAARQGDGHTRESLNRLEKRWQPV